MKSFDNEVKDKVWDRAWASSTRLRSKTYYYIWDRLRNKGDVIAANRRLSFIYDYVFMAEFSGASNV